MQLPKPMWNLTSRFLPSVSPSPSLPLHCVLCSHRIMSLLRLQAPWSRDWVWFDVWTETNISWILIVASSLDCLGNCSKSNNYCLNFIWVMWVAWTWWATQFAAIVTVHWTEPAVRPWVSHFTFLSFPGCKMKDNLLKKYSMGTGCYYCKELTACGFWVCFVQHGPSPLEKLRDLWVILVVVNKKRSSVNKEKWELPRIGKSKIKHICGCTSLWATICRTINSGVHI